MKPLNQLLSCLLVTAGVLITGSAQAQTLTPTVTNSAAVTAIIDGRTNYALASNGSTSFANSCLGTTWTNTFVNDGGSSEAWIAGTSANGEYVGIAFTNTGGVTLGAMVFYGKYLYRSDGIWSLQYTTNASPGVGTPASAWKQIGTYTFSGGGVMPRSIFEFAAVSNVTGVRLIVTNATTQVNVQELEAYGPPTVPAFSPSVTGAGVASVVAGRTNWALASKGGTASCLSSLSGYGPELAIDGSYVSNAYLPASTSANEFLIVAFSNSITLGAVVWGDCYNNRSVGFYELDYTTNTFGGGTTNWTGIGRYYFPEGAGGVANTVMPRSYFELATAITNVTGMRLRFLYAASVSLGTHEFEAYPPLPPALPAVLTPPANSFAAVGDTFTLTVVGTGATSYQWQQNGTNLAGATASSLTIANAQLTNAGFYTVVLSNYVGSVTSAPPAVMTVQTPLVPVATSDTTVSNFVSGYTNLALASRGATAFASSSLSGFGPGFVNNGVNDGTGNAWIANTANNGEFVGVTFTNAGGVTLGALAFDGQYAARCDGTWSLQYTTNAVPDTTSPGTNWTQIGVYTWATTAVMPRTLFEFATISNVTGVRLVIANDPNTTADSVQELEAYPPLRPAISTQPAGATVGTGNDYTFTVTNVGVGPLSYQWQKDGAALAGATNATLVFGFVDLTNAGSYTVVVSNPYGSVTSAPPAVLTVLQSLSVAASGTAVSGVVSGYSNLALASRGSTAFASSSLGSPWVTNLVNDGVSGEAWIAGTAANGEYIGVAFTNVGGVTLGALAFNGKYGGRSWALWSLQYTTNASPGVSTPASAWTQIGIYNWRISAVMARTLFEFAAISNVTGVRLVCSNALVQPNVEELEAYGTMPPIITAPPASGAGAVGDAFTFTVTGSGGVSYQWQKDGVNLAGATAGNLTFGYLQLTNAGNYTVVLSNLYGSVTSSPAAVLTVTNFPSYQAAILAENPIHFYPLNDASGTTAADLGSLSSNATYTGGCTLGQPGPATNGGNSVYFNGASGTYVNLGLFHPGNEMTVECWANLDADARTNFNSLVARWDASYELDFGADGYTPSFISQNAATNYAGVNAPIATRGNWHHLVGVYQTNGTQTIYKDGVATTGARAAGVLKNLIGTITPDEVLIGATRNGSGNFSFNFKGYIANVAFYDHAVSSNRLVAHYNYAIAAVDTNPPVLTSVACTNGFTIRAVFNETVRNASATNLANYTVNSGAYTVTNAVLQADFKTVALSLSSPISGCSLTVAATNVLDVAGNAAANAASGTPILPPVANADSLSWGKGTSNKDISIANLLANDTVACGYTIALAGVDATSANGVTLSTNATYIQYPGALTNNDSFHYTISDGHGGTATALVSITATNSTGQVSGTITVSGGQATTWFYGISGDSYVVQRSTNLNTGAGWVNISTNTAPASGVITNLDTFIDLSPPPAAAYYRLQTH